MNTVTLVVREVSRTEWVYGDVSEETLRSDPIPILRRTRLLSDFGSRLGPKETSRVPESRPSFRLQNKSSEDNLDRVVWCSWVVRCGGTDPDPTGASTET